MTKKKSDILLIVGAIFVIATIAVLFFSDLIIKCDYYNDYISITFPDEGKKMQKRVLSNPHATFIVGEKYHYEEYQTYPTYVGVVKKYKTSKYILLVDLEKEENIKRINLKNRSYIITKLEKPRYLFRK